MLDFRYGAGLRDSVIAALLVFCHCLTTSAQTRQDGAQGPIDVSKMAAEFERVLRQNGKKEVYVDNFLAPPQTNASAGPAIKIGLVEELTTRGIALKRRTEWSIAGGYRLADVGGGLAVQLEGRIVDRGGMEVYSGTWDLGGEPAIVSLFGPSSTLPLDKGEDGRKKALRESIEAPKASITGTIVRGGTGSPYGVEISVAANDSWTKLSPKDDEGLAFAPIKRGDRYAVTLYNDSDEDVAVTLTIDGLNIFRFSKNTDYKYVVIPKKSHGMIKGWHRTNEVSDSFLITELAKGVAAETGESGANVGTITATFAAAWPMDASPPKVEEPLLASRGTGNATARGPEIRAKFTEVVRRVGTPRAVVSVRYDKPR